jgi:two-component system, OmpR family, sensor histidine kinase SenX3
MTTVALWLALVVVAFAAGAALARRSGGGRVAPEAADEHERVTDGSPEDGTDGLTAQSAQNLPRALWNLPLGIVLADHSGQVVYRNAVAQGFADGRHSDALVDAAITELAGEALGTGRTERTLHLYGPPRRHLAVKAAPMLDGDRLTGSLVITEDVTEQHRVDAIRRDFVANVSHELKTPVGAIGVLAEALRGEDDPEVVDRLTGRLQDEAIRLGHTIDDLLALSRIESGELFEPIEVDLDDIVDAAIARNTSAAELRGVTLSARPADEAVVVLGDRRQLVSAVGNLVENAIKYSDPASEVTVAVSDDGRRGVIEVTDRGVGIPETALERIFERFYRVDPARSRNTGGTGLGLSIVRHVALNHGGEVTVRSAEGQGSTFALRLPTSSHATIPDGPGDAVPATASAPPQRGGGG